MDSISKADYSKCDYNSMCSNSNHMEIHLAYGRYQRHDPYTGKRTQVLMMYGYNRATQRAEDVLPLNIEHDGTTMWLMHYTYKSRDDAFKSQDLRHGVAMGGEFWSEVTPEMHQRSYIR